MAFRCVDMGTDDVFEKIMIRLDVYPFSEYPWIESSWNVLIRDM
jgi:hypothetical protein